MSTHEKTYELGLGIRKDVLGDKHVEASLSQASDFARPMQELVTEYCWGAIWGRPGLERKTRSIINIAMLTALDRQSELALHIRGSLNNGCTREEIREILLQAAVYCGVPAALEAFKTAERVLDEFDPVGASAHEVVGAAGTN